MQAANMLRAVAVCFAAAGAGATSQPTEGTLRTRDGKEVVDVPLAHTSVRIRAVGFVADVEVEQRFRNPYRNKIEATYLFPLPTRAAVGGYAITTGGRTIAGELRLRDEAAQKYQAAVAAGHVAALLTQERPNLFTQSVANIEPGAEVAVTLRYVEPLAPTNNGYELVFPMVAGPRHVPASSKLTPEAAAMVQAPALPPGLRSSHDIDVSVTLDTGLPAREVTSPSHRIDQAGNQVTLGAGDTVPNKDFILRYRLAGDAPAFALLAHRAGDAGSFFLLAEPPAAAAAAAVPRELVFVVDTSSSMAGAPLAKAREAVRQALAALGPHDTFQIVAFDDAATALAPRGVAAKPRNLELARAWLDALAASGGTDVAAAVRLALDMPRDPGRLRLVVFVTDGFVGNEDEILALVQEKAGDARVFALGVGSAPNRYLLEEMAALGRGAARFVRADEDPAAAVAGFARPLLTDVAIDWRGLTVTDVTPGRLPDLFAGQPLVVYGRYARPGAATIRVTATRAGQPIAFDVSVDLPPAADRPAVAATWARARIAELGRKLLRGETPEIKKQIVYLALEHKLMTRYTAFVAVDASRTTQGGKAETVPVPVEVPADVRRSAVVAMDGYSSGSASGYGVLGGTSGGGGHAMLLQVREAPVEGRDDDAPLAKRDELRGALGRCSITPEARAKAVLRLDIGADGHVSSVSLVDVPPDVAACVAQEAKKWKMPARYAGKHEVALKEVTP